LAAAGRVVVLPVAATEQHGPHLATGTDTVLAERLALEATRRTGDVLLPTLDYGCSLGHTDRWPGTISLHPSTMTAVVVEIGRWVYASGFRKLVILNSHATNGPPCQSAILQLRYELPDLRLRFVSTFELSGSIHERFTRDAPDLHANEAETSLMLHLAPDQVRLDRAVDEPDRTIGRVFQYPMPQVTASGVVGAPSTATPAAGGELFDQLVEALVHLLGAAAMERDPDLTMPSARAGRRPAAPSSPRRARWPPRGDGP
jgi:creatinine amidohydrolase